MSQSRAGTGEAKKCAGGLDGGLLLC